ncbi:MAG: rod shape-determining protein MreC [Holosporaceae bacterium]|jgi:rod shape-determining protein MreC|nr:rod shape-determining protein MreC [Holosporaceae bacterium]
MRKKIVEGRNSFPIFRRFRKRKILLNIVFYCGIIALFHTAAGNYFTGKCRFLINSANVVMGRWGDKLEKIILNFCHFMSHDVESQLMNLYNENIKLQETIANLKNLQLENEQLKKLLLLKESTHFSTITAKVINIFSNDFTQLCVLNVGQADGVSEGDAVKNSEGLIGRITEINDTWSYALLITDMNSSIPIKIGELAVNAIMTGGNSNKILISRIHEDIPLKEGDLVKTSGYGICEDIPVGKIIKNNKKFLVQPFVDFNSLKYVIIVKKKVDV